MARRYYSSVAVPTTLSSGINSGATSITVTASTGWPSSYPFTLLIDEGTAYEELITVTATSGGGAFTVTRGSDGTTAQAHSTGAAVRHAFSARDLDEPNSHIATSAAVHGLTGTVVGTSDSQTLTNKTLTSPTVNNPTLVLKQSASPTPTAEGDVQWDTDDNKIKVGDGASTKTFSDDSVASGVHGVSGSVVGTTDSQTLTNKTLTSPTINGATIATSTVTTPTLTLKQSASPTPTAEGDIQWDTDDNRVAVGDGASTLTITPDTGTATLTNKTINSSTIGSSTTFSVPTGRKNMLSNGSFEVYQRGASGFMTDGAYPSDRWFVKKSTSDYWASNAHFAAGDLDGVQGRGISIEPVGSGGAGDYVRLCQQIEDVRTLAGKTVTLSFWAKATSGTPKIGVEFEQYFGTGAPPTPSSRVTGTGTTVTLSTTYTRYSVTVAIPSITSKDIGTNGDSYLQLNLWLSAGSTYNTRAGSIGSQTFSMGIAMVQLEEGSVATPFEKLHPQQTLAECQRYYEAGSARWDGYIPSGVGASTPVYYKVSKRTSVAPSQTNDGNTNFGATPGNADYSADGYSSYRVATGTGSALFAETWIVNAEFTPA